MMKGSRDTWDRRRKVDESTIDWICVLRFTIGHHPIFTEAAGLPVQVMVYEFTQLEHAMSYIGPWAPSPLDLLVR